MAKNPIKTPKITHLQAVVLSALVDRNQLYGRELRERIFQLSGTRKSLAAFYQLMARMEDANLIVGRYEEKNVGGVAITERVYKISGEGSLQLGNLRVFYKGLLPNAI